MEVALREAMQTRPAAHEVGHRLRFNLALGKRERPAIRPKVSMLFQPSALLRPYPKTGQCRQTMNEQAR